MSLGLVLSGGGVRGSAHIGVIKALHEANIRPTMVAGTSAGSIVAGLYAYGYSPDEIGIIARKISRYYIDIDYSGIFRALLSLFLNYNIQISGLVKGDLLERILHRLTHGVNIKDIRIPLAITAVDINNAKLVVFTNKPATIISNNSYLYLSNYNLAEAIRASIAIPGIFKPKIIQKMRLIDGGVRANLPVEVIRSMGAKKVIAVNLGYSGYPVPGVDDIVEISLQAIDLMIYQITIPSLNSADAVIAPLFSNVKHSDMSKIDYLIKCGYESTKIQIPQIKRMLQEINNPYIVRIK